MSMARVAVAAAAARTSEEMQAQSPGDRGAKKPGARGSKQCWCQGEFLVMVGHYGWIYCVDCIDHPDAGKHDGDIYVSKRDLGGLTFKTGDIIGFYLYADEQGLGAEACTLIKSAAIDANVESCWASAWKDVGADGHANAPAGTAYKEGGEWDCWGNVLRFSDQSVPTPSLYGEPPTFMNPHVAEFVPTFAFMMNPLASEFVPTQPSDGLASPRLGKDDCVSTSEGEEDSFASSDCSSDAEPGQTHMAIRPPPGLTLPPWRKGMRKPRELVVAEPVEGDSSGDDVQDESKKGTAPPWRRNVKSIAIESDVEAVRAHVSIPLQAPPGLTLPTAG
jgi:hypothetical protein